METGESIERWTKVYAVSVVTRQFTLPICTTLMHLLIVGRWGEMAFDELFDLILELVETLTGSSEGLCLCIVFIVPLIVGAVLGLIYLVAVLVIGIIKSLGVPGIVALLGTAGVIWGASKVIELQVPEDHRTSVHSNSVGVAIIPALVAIVVSVVGLFVWPHLPSITVAILVIAICIAMLLLSQELPQENAVGTKEDIRAGVGAKEVTRDDDSTSVSPRARMPDRYRQQVDPAGRVAKPQSLTARIPLAADLYAETKPLPLQEIRDGFIEHLPPKKRKKVELNKVTDQGVWDVFIKDEGFIFANVLTDEVIRRGVKLTASGNRVYIVCQTVPPEKRGRMKFGWAGPHVYYYCLGDSTTSVGKIMRVFDFEEYMQEKHGYIFYQWQESAE